MSNLILSAFMILMLVGGSNTLAATSSPPEPADASVAGYPVVLGDKVLFYVRAVQAYSGDHRAAAISGRLKTLSEDYSFSPDSIMVVDSEISADIVAADRMIMSVFDSDARAEKVKRNELAEKYVQKIRPGIETYRQEYSRKALFLGILYLLIATLALIAVVYLLNRIYRRGEHTIQEWVRTKKLSLHIKSFEIIRAERIRILLTTGIRLVRFLVLLVLFYTFAHLGLSFFPWTRGFAGRLLTHIVVPVQFVGRTVWTQIPNFIVLAIVVLVTVYVLKVTRLLFSEIEKGSFTIKEFYPEWAQPTYRICRISIIAFAAVVAFPYIPGSESPAFKGISIFLGILFSLGSTSFIANILAGYTLTYRRVFKVGDRVKIADFVGDVVNTRLQVTHLRTIKNEEIIVPNSMIVSSHVINYSSLALERGLILHTTVTIGYDVPWRQVHAMLLMAADRTTGLLREPPPFILQKSLDDFYVTYELNVYTDKAQEMATRYSELHQNIQDAFNEHGVQIMSPNYVADPAGPKLVPRERWFAAPAKPDASPKTPEGK